MTRNKKQSEPIRSYTRTFEVRPEESDPFTVTLVSSVPLNPTIRRDKWGSKWDRAEALRMDKMIGAIQDAIANGFVADTVCIGAGREIR